MKNPFESGHIKNYILLYASVVVIIILFFIATTLFHDVKKIDKKTFNTVITKELKTESVKKEEVAKRKFKLLDEKFIK